MKYLVVLILGILCLSTFEKAFSDYTKMQQEQYNCISDQQVSGFTLSESLGRCAK